jgi:hypothetical protein
MREFSSAECDAPTELEEFENSSFAFTSPKALFGRTSLPGLHGRIELEYG